MRIKLKLSKLKLMIFQNNENLNQRFIHKSRVSQRLDKKFNLKKRFVQKVNVIVDQLKKRR